MQDNIRDYILRDANNDDLNQIIEFVKMRCQVLSRQNTFTLRRGATVRWSSTRNGGMVMQGTVEDIKIKNVIVATAQGKWKVPANMLEVV